MINRVAFRIMLIFAIIIAIFININIYAVENIPPIPMQNVRVYDIGYENEDSYDWFADLRWDAPAFPGPEEVEGITRKGQEVRFDKFQRGTGTYVEKDFSMTLPESINELKTLTYGVELDHGTIYAFSGRSYYTLESSGEEKIYSGLSAKA